MFWCSVNEYDSFSYSFHNYDSIPTVPESQPPTSSVFVGKDKDIDTRYGVCPHCGNATLHVSPASGIHHSRLDCLGCGRFVKWVPDTSKDEELRRRVEAVDLSRIKGIDHTFIVNLQRQVRISRRDKKRFKLSPKQLRWLSDIEEGEA